MCGTRPFFCGLMMLAVLSGGATTAAGEKITLADGWNMQSSLHVQQDGAALSSADASTEGWYPIRVPSTVLAALVENQVYPDPYYGENLKKIPGYRPAPWIAMAEDSPFYSPWWFQTSFEVPQGLEGKHAVLHFDGISYRANVWLNGEKIVDDQKMVGMFREFEYDVTDALHYNAPNYLAVEITAAGHIPDIQYRTKQLEATTGWDDHNPYPPDMNMGLWQEVALTFTGPVLLRHPFVQTDLDVPSLESARLTVFVDARNTTDRDVKGVVRAVFPDEGWEVTQEVALKAGETKTVSLDPETYDVLRVDQPRVWWPNPLGPQELYNVDIAFEVDGTVSDSTQTRFGIREATSFIDEDGWRAYRVNGHRVLIRGGAWMTTDMLLRLSHRRYEALIRYAREANLNMLRSEGFSIRETEDFYNLCDEYGVMVTQQIFGRNIPEEDLAVSCIEDMILRIRNHPSLVHFIGHDETYPTETLDQAYRDLIARYSPHVTYQPNSGDRNETREKSGGTRTGWRLIWTYADPLYYYDDMVEGLEYDAWGFAQSGGIGGIVAPYESIRRFIPEDEQWPLWSDSMSFHTVTQGHQYFETVTTRLKERYGEPTGIQDFCKKAMALNYECARAMFEAWGREKYRAKGITTWKYDNAWPAVMAWQYIDWYLIPTGAYYGAKRACEPVHIQYSYDDHSVWVLNSYYRDFTDLQAEATIYNFDLTEKGKVSAVVNVGSDGKTKAFDLDLPDSLSKAFFVALKLTDKDGQLVSRNFYWLSTIPDVIEEVNRDWRAFSLKMKSSADFTSLNTLPETKVDAQCEFGLANGERTARVTLTNPSDNLAFYVTLAIRKGKGGEEASPVYWEDNYFPLMPGETRDVQAVFAEGDLNGATPVVAVSGWNVTTQELE